MAEMLELLKQLTDDFVGIGHLRITDDTWSEGVKRAAIAKTLEFCLGNRPETWLKHQHTLDFLKIANQKCNDYEEAMAQLRQEPKTQSDRLPE
jgi:hypothetical protein